MRYRRSIIYKSRTHLAVTLIVVAAPFLYLILFSRFTHIASKNLGGDVLVSLGRLCMAYVISAVVGWILAVSLYRGKRSVIALPVFDVCQSFPTFALLPLAVLTFGASNTTIVVFLVFTIIWPIIFSIVSSLKLIKRDWYETAQIYHLRGWRYLQYFLFPASVSGLIVGTIIGLGEGWEALIATEIIVQANHGLGSFFKLFEHNAAVTTFGVLGFLLLVFSINHLIWLPLLEWSHEHMEE